MIRCAVNLFGRLAMARVVGQVFACTPMCSGGAAKRKPFAIQVRNPKDGAKADRSIAQLKRIAKAAGVPAEEFSELKSWPAPQSYPLRCRSHQRRRRHQTRCDRSAILSSAATPSPSPSLDAVAVDSPCVAQALPRGKCVHRTPNGSTASRLG